MSAPSDNGSGSIAADVRSGLVVTGGSDAIRQAAEFLTGIVMARLLLPQDFGVVAVVGSILQLSFVVGNFGMGTAVIQVRELTRSDSDTAFTLSAVVGLLLMLVTIAITPWATGFFAMPGLASLMPVMSVQLLISGMSAIPVALLRRELAYRKTVIIEAGSTLTYAAVGVTLALNGYGVWSLVWAPVVSALWTLGASMIASRYRPRLTHSKESFDKFFGYSSGLTVKNVFVYLSRNVDNLITAKMLGDYAAGVYTRAFNLTRTPQMRLVALIYRVCFPAFCKLQNDRERLHRWYLTATAMVAVVATPILLGIAAVADEFSVAVLGPQWAGMSPVLRVLSIGALINCLHMLGGAVIEAVGMIRYEVLTQAVYATGIFFGCVLGAHYGGIVGVSYGVLVASIVFYLLKGWTVRAAVGLPIHEYVSAAVPSLAAGAVMFVCVYALLHTALTPAWLTGTWTRLLVGTAVGAVIYPAALAVFARSHARLFFDQVATILQTLRRRSRIAQPSTIQA